MNARDSKFQPKDPEYAERVVIASMQRTVLMMPDTPDTQDAPDAPA